MASDQSPPIPDEQDSTSPDDKARLTLLRAVALSRPLDEVASLAHLLNQTGEQPRPGDEALHLAAVSRPLDEVRQLISLLKKPPHTDDEADTALRAVAAERSIEDVAALIADCHPHANAPRDEPAPTQETALVPFGPEALAPPVPAPMPMTAAAVMPPSAAPVNGDQGDGGQVFTGPGEHAPAVDNATAHSTPAHGPVESGPAESGTAKSGPVESGPVENGPAAPEAGAATAGTAASRAPALRSVLRWPAAAALLLIGVLHLPNDIMAVHTGNRTAAASMVIAAICLTLAVLLPLYDTVWAWALGAGAAVATAAVHSVGAGFKSVHLLRNSLGSTFAGATTIAVLCAVVAAVLAATVLLRKPAQQRAADKA
ncbi:hypothetical protein [Streptomyces xanthochromogenes]|uniref:hypothetical protein n=1 Tax=Streptomyces xanthochromogenes TaxID=67384 RepID=UPI00343B5BC0